MSWTWICYDGGTPWFRHMNGTDNLVVHDDTTLRDLWPDEDLERFSEANLLLQAAFLCSSFQFRHSLHGKRYNSFVYLVLVTL